MARRTALILGAMVVGGIVAVGAVGLDDAVRCEAGTWRNEYGCVAPCPPGSGRTEPGTVRCVPRDPVATPLP